MTVRETAQEIEAAAARWVWRLDRDGPTAALEAELAAWLEADPRRRGAFLQAQAVWAMLDRGRQLARDRPRPRPRATLSRRAVLGGGALAACAGAVAYLALGHDRYSTAIGEIRRVPLKDGSTIALNTESQVEVAMDADARVVRMARGEAWFQVAHNPGRPFVVEAGRIRVRAVGTAFSVRRHADGAEVLVTEGRVEAWAAGAEGHRITLGPGERARLTETAAISAQAPGSAEIDRELAWRAGKIDLAGETLAQAVAEFNRHNTRKLVLVDPQLAQARFYGVFRTDDPAGFALAVQQSLGARVSIETPGEIRIAATSE